MSDAPHPFDHYLRQPEPVIRVCKAALLFSADEWPDLDVSHYLRRLDRLALEVGAERTRDAMDQWQAIRRVVVERHGLIGNDSDYQNPDNSYLNRVLDTRRGIPITLSAIWLHVAENLDWPLVGIGLPGHFIIRHQGMEDEAYIDPFGGGALLTAGQCAALVRRLLGPQARITEEMLLPATPRQMLRRMLGNLYAHYLRVPDWRRAATVLTRMAAVSPDEIPIRAELARVLINGGRLSEAGAALDSAEERTIFEQDRRLVAERRLELQRRRAETN